MMERGKLGNLLNSCILLCAMSMGVFDYATMLWWEKPLVSLKQKFLIVVGDRVFAFWIYFNAN